MCNIHLTCTTIMFSAILKRLPVRSARFGTFQNNRLLIGYVTLIGLPPEAKVKSRCHICIPCHQTLNPQT